MRRYALFLVVPLSIAASMPAWLHAQEASRRRPTRMSFSDGGDFRQVAGETGAPRPFSAGDAMPIDADEPQTLSDDEAVVPAAGPAGDTNAASGRSPRPLGTSRLGPGVIPAAPTNLDGEISGDAPPASPNMPSVLKKKAGSPPTRSGGQSRLTPTTIGDGPALDADGSSRRVVPQSKPLSIRPTENPTLRTTTPSVKARSTAPEMLQLSGSSPKLVVEAEGPQAVTVGKPASYTIRVENESQSPAEGVEVRIALPAWVQVQGGEGSRGDARQQNDESGRPWLVWALPDLAAGGKEQLALTLVVRQNQPFELGLQWSARAMAASAEVAVQEPQLEVRLEGPSDMLFGEQKTFTLHVSNPGSGEAEGVFVEVTSGGQPNRLEVGTLPAGEQKQIPFTVAAIAPGEMEIRAAASGTADLAAEALARVHVHKAALEVAIDVPPLHFAGAESIIPVGVANIGDAVAEQVTLSITLPPGAKYIGGLDGVAKGEGLNLKIGNLAAGAEKTFELRCILNASGENHFEVRAQAKQDLLASTTGVTTVEALSDVKLAVAEPTVPVAVGSETTYEVRLTNRGTKSAENVKVVVQFGPGIEPIEATGGNASLANGQAIYEPIAEMAAGTEVVLKVKAKSIQAGRHAFRVEVKGGDDLRLVSEGVTRCFTEAGGMRATARQPATLEPTPATKIR